MDTRRPEPGALQPLPARVLRRPAAAHRRRARARAEAEGDRRRRAGLRARRLDPGAGAQPAARPAARPRPDADLHRPRPLGRAPHVRPRRGDVPGRIVELASSDQLYAHPRMPYTGALMSAVPVADPRLAAAKKRQVLTGDVPSPTNPPPGCRFHTRCWKAQEICRTEDPPLEAKDGGNLAACHFPLTDAEVLERVPSARNVTLSVRAPRAGLRVDAERLERAAGAAAGSRSAERSRSATPITWRAVGGGLAQRLVEDLARVDRHGRCALGGRRPRPASVGWAAARALLERHAVGAQRRGGDAVAGAQDAQQQVLGAHPRGAERGRLLGGELDRGARLRRDAQARGLRSRRAAARSPPRARGSAGARPGARSRASARPSRRSCRRPARARPARARTRRARAAARTARAARPRGPRRGRRARAVR